MPKKMGYANDSKSKKKKGNSKLDPNKYSYETKRSDMSNKKTNASKYKK